MSSKSKKLGSLADVFKSEALDGTIRRIRLDKIRPSEIQPRQERKKGVEELAKSLRKEGLLQPIVVTRIEGPEECYRIIAGERRYHAASSLGWVDIECKIFDRNEKETFRLAVVENLQREDLSPYEEVDALLYLKKEHGFTDQELADMFGKSRSYMTEILSIAQLSSESLRLCKEYGIENKNLLVQAAQAEKKGTLDEFLGLYRSGNLKTVKDAKEFNRNPSPRGIATKPEKMEKEISPQIRITKKDGAIQITCSDPVVLGEIYKFARKEIQRRFGQSFSEK